MQNFLAKRYQTRNFKNIYFFQREILTLFFFTIPFVFVVVVSACGIGHVHPRVYHTGTSILERSVTFGLAAHSVSRCAS